MASVSTYQPYVLKCVMTRIYIFQFMAEKVLQGCKVTVTLNLKLFSVFLKVFMS